MDPSVYHHCLEKYYHENALGIFSPVLTSIPNICLYKCTITHQKQYDKAAT